MDEVDLRFMLIVSQQHVDAPSAPLPIGRQARRAESSATLPWAYWSRPRSPRATRRRPAPGATRPDHAGATAGSGSESAALRRARGSPCRAGAITASRRRQRSFGKRETQTTVESAHRARSKSAESGRCSERCERICGAPIATRGSTRVQRPRERRNFGAFGLRTLTVMPVSDATLLDQIRAAFPGSDSVRRALMSTASSAATLQSSLCCSWLHQRL